MKKVYLFIAAVMLISAPSLLRAQSLGLGLGIKAGANFANQSIPDVNTDSRTGFHGGAYAVIPISTMFAIQPEVLFSSMGANLPNGKNDFKYLSIPLLVSLSPIEFLSIEVGPQFSSLLSAKLGDEDIKDEIKKSDFGLVAGATIHLPLGLNAGARYVWGFSNVSDLPNDKEIKNTAIQVFAGWTLFGQK